MLYSTTDGAPQTVIFLLANTRKTLKHLTSTKVGHRMMWLKTRHALISLIQKEQEPTGFPTPGGLVHRKATESYDI